MLTPYIYEILCLHILLVYIYLYILLYDIIIHSTFHLYNFSIDFVRVYEIIYNYNYAHNVPSEEEKKFLIQIISCRIP